MSHPVVSLVYVVLQLAVSLVMVYVLPDQVLVQLGLFGNSDCFVGSSLSLVHEEILSSS